jgi:hypothetical protein
LRISKGNHQHSQHREIFKVPHTHLLLWIFARSDPEALSNPSIYWNAWRAKKLRRTHWLISAIPVDFNHLQAEMHRRLSGLKR